MIGDSDDKKMMTRRSMMLGLGGAGVFGVLASRLYYLQVVRSEDYRVLSDKNRFNFNTIIPERGRILDRFGSKLAANQQDFKLLLVPERVRDIDQTLSRIDQIVPLSQRRRKHILKDIKQNPEFVGVMVAEHLNWSEFSRLNMKLPDLPGVTPIEGLMRHYNFDGVFSHITGYVGKAGPKDLQKDKDPLLREPTFRIGKSGIEQALDKTLRGKAGRKKVEVNALGRIVKEWENDNIPATPGKDVWLTLDAGLQTYAAEQFGDDSGGVAVMDVHTGELRVLLSMPSFDANLFVSGLTNAEMKRLNGDPKRPQFNKVIGGTYPPASTFKMAVMLAALEQKIIDPKEQVFCTGKTKLGNRDFHCWERRGHGLMNMHDALQHSCDVYFYEIIQRLGMENVVKVADRLGFGQTFDIHLAGQARGVVPDPAWKQRKLGSAWRMGDALNATIGQGFTLATPLQLAVMCARIANGAKAVQPSLVVQDKLPEFEDLGIDPNHVAFVQNAMRSVCETPGGTAFGIGSLGLAGVEMGGKTGTGQVRGISVAERRSGVLKNRELPWKLRDHKVFVGFAPYAEPRFAAAVYVEHSGAKARRAIEICKNVLGTALRNDGYGEQVQPTGENN